MEGNSAVTTVNGKPCLMREGDLILTPNWCWHGHANPGNENVVWFNGLDLPLTFFYNAGFHEHGHGDEPVGPSDLPDESYARGGLVSASPGDALPYSPMFRYAGSDVLEALRALPAEPDGSRKLRYVDPTTGGPVMPTMDLYLLDLPKSGETRPYRTTSNAMCVVVEGAGVTRIEGHSIRWEKGDVFTLPHWSWITHKFESAPARLFQSTDRELLRYMHLLREEFAS
jgi:gentisate 1,2-dioxygenase